MGVGDVALFFSLPVTLDPIALACYAANTSILM